MKKYQDTLQKLENEGLKRNLKTYKASEDLLNFSSNDYLGLSKHPEVIKAAVDATYQYGSSASASRLMSGNLAIHQQLENELASFLGHQTALIFGSGFLNNIGMLSALVGRDDLIFSDKLNHASLIDGSVLSRAKVIRYRHNDLTDLEASMQKVPAGTAKFIVTESVFSMDGDIADVDGLIELAERFEAILIVDEAHAIGVFGAGLASNKQSDNLVIVGTLSKALASYGGFVACSHEIKELLINKARSFIYSTALPPSCCAAAMAALNIIRSDLQIGQTVLTRARLLHSLITKYSKNPQPFNSQIVPLVVGPNNLTSALSEALLKNNILCTAVRPPTVPANTSRLRFSVCNFHSDSDIQNVSATIERLLNE